MVFSQKSMGAVFQNTGKKLSDANDHFREPVVEMIPWFSSLARMLAPDAAI
jgi:hypothetical protein